MLRCFRRSELIQVHCTLRLQDLQRRRVMEGVVAWKAEKSVQSVPPSLAHHEYKVGNLKNAYRQGQYCKYVPKTSICWNC